MVEAPAAADSALSENSWRVPRRCAYAGQQELHRVPRAAVFFLFASAVWALLPLVARQMLGGSSGFYGVLLGAVGAGRSCALLLPRLGKLDADGLVLLASVASAAVMAALVFAPPVAGVLLLVVLGMGWITALTTFNSVAQAIPPNCARPWPGGVPTVFNGAMAAGSRAGAWWRAKSACLCAGGQRRRPGPGRAVVPPRPLPVGEADLQVSNHWPEPLVAGAGGARSWPGAGAGGVPHPSGRPPRLPGRHEAPVAGAPALGAYAWGVVEHTGDAERVVEWFRESWPSICASIIAHRTPTPTFAEARAMSGRTSPRCITSWP